MPGLPKQTARKLPSRLNERDHAGESERVDGERVCCSKRGVDWVEA